MNPHTPTPESRNLASTAPNGAHGPAHQAWRAKILNAHHSTGRPQSGPVRGFGASMGTVVATFPAHAGMTRETR